MAKRLCLLYIWSIQKPVKLLHFVKGGGFLCFVNRKCCLIWLLQFNNKELLLCDFVHNADGSGGLCDAFGNFVKSVLPTYFILVNQVYANDVDLTQYTLILYFLFV